MLRPWTRPTVARWRIPKPIATGMALTVTLSARDVRYMYRLGAFQPFTFGRKSD